MAKYINLDHLIRFIKENGYVYASIIENWPTVDAVEVVRCKDCEWWERGKDYTPYCNHPVSGLFTAEKENNFCSYGERREENGES